MTEWFALNKGLRDGYVESVAEAQAILERVGDYHAAHLDLAGAYFRAGDWDACEGHCRRALELGYPAPGLIYNYLACVAARRFDIKAMQEHFMAGAKADPQHHILISNVDRARRWFRENGPELGLPLELTARHDFQLFERTVQPTLPGPLPPDFAEWNAALPPRRSETQDGQARARRLPVV
jgi:hypothetical protein